MPALIRSTREPPIDDERSTRSTDYFGHFRQIATMIEILDRLPELAGDIASGRLLRRARFPMDALHDHEDEISRAYGELSPLTQRAFQAVVAGIDKLAETAVDLCDHAHEPPTPGEAEAGAEIGRSLRQLLERAIALVESAAANSGDRLSRQR
jgi:hypothetical protein